MAKIIPAALLAFATAYSLTLGHLSWSFALIDSIIVVTKDDEKSLGALSGHFKPLVAVVMAATTKKTGVTEYNQTDLATVMLPSLLNTTEADKFQYSLFVGVDDDDAFWTNETNWRYLKEQAGSAMTVQVSAFPNKLHRIPFNEILRVAHDAGADYFVRINDDTEFVTNNWTSLGVEALAAFSPPNVGVVGPTCSEQRKGLLAHDMVHRTHMDIFNNTYYPEAFDNWYIDDWISTVYGPNRTTVIQDWEVLHHVVYLIPGNFASKKTRYRPNIGQGKFLQGEKSKGQLQIQEWLERHNDNTTLSSE